MIRGALRRWLVGAVIAGSIAAVGAKIITLSATATATSGRSRGRPHLTDPRRGQSATEASCVGLTQPEQRAAAKVIVIGRMLPGPAAHFQNHQVLLFPARMRVSRYLKGSGPRTVEVQTGVRLSSGQIQMQEDGILPSAGERWEILSSSRQMPLLSSICLGSRRSTSSQSPRPSASRRIDPTVAAELSVFRRAQTRADALPTAYRAELRQAYASVRPDVANARRVKASDGQAAYLVPANGGACVINVNEAFCSQAASLPGADAVDLCSPRLPKGQIEIEWLLPDRATKVALGMTSGATRRFATSFNVYIARLPVNRPLPKTIEWDDARGAHHSVSAGVPGDAQHQGCIHPSDLPASPKASSRPSATTATAMRPTQTVVGP